MEYWNKLPAQKKEWVKWIAVVLLVGILGLLGITQPTIPVPPTPAPAVGGEIGARAVARTGIICNGGETNCVDARSGKDIVTYADADAATRTWYVDGATGNQTALGYYSGSNWAKVAAPTAIATATPALVVNNAGVSKLLDLQKAGTPVAYFANDGGLQLSGVTTNTNSLLNLAAQTAIPTAKPVAVINSAGMSNLLEVQKNATPVFTVNQAGTITGYVLQYGSTGQKEVCGSTVITGTGTIAHGLATPSYVTYGIAQDVTGDGASLSHTNSSATVTIKAWSAALTPAAASTPVTVDWCVKGTP